MPLFLKIKTFPRDEWVKKMAKLHLQNAFCRKKGDVPLEKPAMAEAPNTKPWATAKHCTLELILFSSSCEGFWILS